MSRRRPGWAPVFRPNARQNKDLEHVRDAIFCQRGLGSVEIHRELMIAEQA